MSTQEIKSSEVMIDIENQNERKENSVNTLQVNLKGILKNPQQQKLHHAEVEKNIFRLCIGLLFLVTMIPIIVCDLYFGFTYSSCSSEPNELISLRLYLIVSGFMCLFVMIVILIALTCFDPEEIKKDGYSLCYDTPGIRLISKFNTIWNILGAVVFWGYFYGKGNCDKTFSTYVFVSLIIKMVASLFECLKNIKMITMINNK